jgi:hypothetical protein
MSSQSTVGTILKLRCLLRALPRPEGRRLSAALGLRARHSPGGFSGLCVFRSLDDFVVRRTFVATARL